MKRVFSICLLNIILLSLLISPGFSQKAADILEKMIEAQGGRKVLESIKDITLSGSIDVMGVSMTITIYKKEPNKWRMDMEAVGMLMSYAFDGEISWSAGVLGQPPTPEKDAEDAKRNFQGYAAILHPEKYGITYALKGKEKIEGKDYFVLEQTLPGGIKAIQYVDTETSLIYKTEYTTINSKGVESKDEIFMSEYKKVDGVMVSHSLTIPFEGQEPLKITITKVSFNMGLEDSLFKMSK